MPSCSLGACALVFGVLVIWALAALAGALCYFAYEYVNAPPPEAVCENGWCTNRTPDCLYRYNNTCCPYEWIKQRVNLFLDDHVEEHVVNTCMRTLELSLKVPSEFTNVCDEIDGACNVVRYYHETQPRRYVASWFYLEQCLQFSREACENFDLCVRPYYDNS